MKHSTRVELITFSRICRVLTPGCSHRDIFLHKTQRNYPENTHVCIKSCFLILEADATNGVTELGGLPCWRWEGGVEAFCELSVPLPRAVCMGDDRTYWGGCQTEDSPGRFHRPLRSWGVSSYSSPPAMAQTAGTCQFHEIRPAILITMVSSGSARPRPPWRFSNVCEAWRLGEK